MKSIRARFSPHPLIRGGNAQTLAAALLPAPRPAYRAERWLVELPDGDRLMLHDDCPGGWRPTDRSALLMHGLGGCHGSPYLVRIAEKLNLRGVRTFRLDLRGCGAGERYARGATHCGSWDDVRRAVLRIAELAPNSPVEAVGFSLGGSLALNLVGRLGAGQLGAGSPGSRATGDARVGNLAGVMAVCPPVDLHALDESFRRGAGRLYSRYLARIMWRQIQRRLSQMPDPPEVDTSRRPRHIRELDEQITAPFHGYRDADHYYSEASAVPYLPAIKLPTRIIAAADDPVIPVKALLRAPRSASVDIVVANSGGHLGFYGREPGDPDANWIDWRVVEWVTRCT
ncbi:MAG: alpha/beta fold hydrolase [Planctomycetota bacterium]